MAGRVRVLSERMMIPGRETRVKTLMLNVESTVRKQNGFVRGEILRDTKNPALYMILTEWETMRHLNKWFETPFYKSIMGDLNSILQKPTSYRILRQAKDEVFLL